MQLYDSQGKRLYLTADERQSFVVAADRADRTIKTFCNVLVHSGCRISEALELTPRRVELGEQCLRFRSLKKRRSKDGQPRIIFRSVPVPPALIEQLNLVYGIREIQNRGDAKLLDSPIWPRTRAWGWLVVKEVMDAAQIPDGPHKTAKGLRHAFGIKAMQAGIQLNMLQKWMGHADLKTTAIYANAIGDEERDIAKRMWDGLT